MRLIHTTADLVQFCDRLAEHDFVTVDTEFIREQTFWPRLCLIQLAGPGNEAIVDPIGPDIELGAFYELMANEKVVKVFHAARRTWRSFGHRHGCSRIRSSTPRLPPWCAASENR
jgi:ribonuclease D